MKRGALAAPIGEARRIRSANYKFLWIFFIRCASPTGVVQIAAPIVLEQHKGNKRIGEARTSIRCASPIVLEIAFLFRCTDRKQNYVQYEATANKKFKIMPSTRVRGQYNEWYYFRPTLVFAGHYL